MTITLTKEEYLSTMKDKMFDVTLTAEPSVDIWDYVKELVSENVVNVTVLQNFTVESVYRNGDNTFHHVLLPTSDQNCFIVIIVDLNNKSIKGHYRLDLNSEYSLT